VTAFKAVLPQLLYFNACILQPHVAQLTQAELHQLEEATASWVTEAQSWVQATQEPSISRHQCQRLPEPFKEEAKDKVVQQRAALCCLPFFLAFYSLQAVNISLKHSYIWQNLFNIVFVQNFTGQNIKRETLNFIFISSFLGSKSPFQNNQEAVKHRYKHLNIVSLLLHKT